MLSGTVEGIYGDDLKESISEQTKTEEAAQRSQSRVDGLDDQTRKMLREYRIATAETESLRVYNEQLKKLIASQKEEALSIETQIDEIEQTHRGVVPLIIRMLDSLEAFVALDVPFLKSERAERIAKLKSMMGRADISTSEKYRRVLEAYQIENEYGRTIEAYRDSIDSAGKSVTVDFFKIGRIAFMYQTLDGAESAVWDHATKKWIELSSSTSKAVKEGLKIARKQAPPDLVRIPVPKAEVL